MTVEYLSIPLMQENFSPFSWLGWTNEQVTREMIQKAIDEKDFISTPFSEVHSEMDNDPVEWTTYDHARRVAYLVVHPSRKAIQIDFGVPVLRFYPDWPITDGNHRYMAAVFRGDPSIAAHIAGQCDVYEHMLVPKPKPPSRADIVKLKEFLATRRLSVGPGSLVPGGLIGKQDDGYYLRTAEETWVPVVLTEGEEGELLYYLREVPECVTSQ